MHESKLTEEIRIYTSWWSLETASEDCWVHITTVLLLRRTPLQWLRLFTQTLVR